MTQYSFFMYDNTMCMCASDMCNFSMFSEKKL